MFYKSHCDHFKNALNQEDDWKNYIKIVKYFIPLWFVLNVIFVSVLFWSEAKRVKQDTNYDETIKPTVDDYFDAKLAHTTFLSHAVQTW